MDWTSFVLGDVWLIRGGSLTVGSDPRVGGSLSGRVSPRETEHTQWDSACDGSLTAGVRNMDGLRLWCGSCVPLGFLSEWNLKLEYTVLLGHRWSTCSVPSPAGFIYRGSVDRYVTGRFPLLVPAVHEPSGRGSREPRNPKHSSSISFSAWVRTSEQLRASGNPHTLLSPKFPH